MFWKKKDLWNEFRVKKPPQNVPVLFCDYDHLWIGKYANGSMDSSRKSYFIFIEDNLTGFDTWVYSYKHQCPIFWRFLSQIPPRDLD